MREGTEDPNRRIARLEADLESARRQAEQWREMAEERRATLERIRQHPLVRVAHRALTAVLPGARRARAAVEDLAERWRRTRRRASALRALPAQLTRAPRHRRLRQALASLPAPPEDPRPVTVVILTRDGRERLEALLPTLAATRHGDLEVLVVDNASRPATGRFLADRSDITAVRLEEHRSYAAGNNAGIQAASGEVVCLLNDDVVPADPLWLGRMLGALDGDTVAVGAQLVYPARPLLQARTPDLTVQHRGVGFEPTPGGMPRAVNRGGGAPDPRGGPVEVPAATGACLLARRSDLLEVGGLDERYDFGAEDVDLCWRLRRRGAIRVHPGAVLFHDEGSTRHRADPAALRKRQQRNWDAFAARLGPEVRRAVALDRIDGTLQLTDRPYTVGITVTRDLEEAGYGDLHTARALGRQLEDLGWRVRLVERYRDAWYDLPEDLDAVVSLLDTFDLRRVARPGLTTVAWIRNWEDRWLAHPWFEDHDVVLTSSRDAADAIAARSRVRPRVVPLATDPDRFHPGAHPGEDREGIVLPVNHWGSDRGVEALLEAVPELELYGRGWEDVPAVAERWRGAVPHDELPALYARSAVVVDRTAGHTSGHGSLNARVFDALAAGALAVTDQVTGAREVFGDRLPTYEDPADLRDLLARLRADPDAARERARKLREEVLAAHTYRHRAESVRGAVRHRAAATSFALLTGAPDGEAGRRWGDTYFAAALARELHARGHPTRILTRDRWGTRASRTADVALQLRGRGRHEAGEGQLHVLWVISHPEEITDEELGRADLVLVASERFAAEVARRTGTPVEVMLQATDERRFRPRPPDPRFDHDVAFVGNSRFTRRPVVAAAVEAGLEPAVYGGNWERFLDPGHVRGSFIPNDELPAAYSTVRVLLNDHWDAMREWGFVSNRLFDALACGASVVSDEIVGLEDLFDGAVATFRDADDLATTVGRLLDDPEERAERGRRGRRAVLEAHTFRHRAERLLALVEEIADSGQG